MQNRPVGKETFGSSMGQAKNYYSWVYSVLKPAIKRRLVEIGVGSGPFIKFYSDLDVYFPTDIDGSMVETVVKSWQQIKPYSIQGIVGDAGQSEYWEKVKSCQPDSMIAVNVLEHIENDDFFLTRAKAALSEKKGTMALFVPAMPSIFGTMDVAAGHFRRYTRKNLKKKVLRAGFKINSLYYFNSMGSLFWFFQGRILKTRKLSDEGLNKNILLYDRFGVPVTRVLDHFFKDFFGQSLVLIAEAN